MQKGVLGIMLAIGLVICSLSNAEVDTKSLVLYLPFDEGSGTPKDLSSVGNKVTIQGTLKWVLGKFGKALEFDGTAANYLEVADNDALDGMKQVTIEVWVQPYKPDALARAIVSKREAAQKGDVYNLFSWTEMKFWGRTNGKSGATEQISSKSVLEEKKWYHLAYLFDGNAAQAERQKLYVNGVLEATLAHPDNTVLKGDSSLWVGTLNKGYAQNWNGIIDELRIWKVAMSEADIKFTMAKGKDIIASVQSQNKLPLTWGNIKAGY